MGGRREHWQPLERGNTLAALEGDPGALQCTALYCTVRCIALFCTVVRIALHCTVLYCSLHCIITARALHCTALSSHCILMYLTALHTTIQGVFHQSQRSCSAVCKGSPSLSACQGSILHLFLSGALSSVSSCQGLQL